MSAASSSSCFFITTPAICLAAAPHAPKLAPPSPKASLITDVLTLALMVLGFTAGVYVENFIHITSPVSFGFAASKGISAISTRAEIAVLVDGVLPPYAGSVAHGPT